MVLPKSSKLKNLSILFLPPSDHTLGEIFTFFLPLSLCVRCPTFSYETLQRARGRLRCGSPGRCSEWSCSSPALQDAPWLARHLLFLLENWGGGNAKRGAHPLPHSSPRYNDERVNRKGTIELVTTVCMGFAEFPVHELQSWSEIHVVGEYHEWHVCPVYVKAVVCGGTIVLIEAISPIR